MGNEYSWKEIEQKFSELIKPLEYLRIDYQWGSVPERYGFVGSNDQNALSQFYTFATLSGKKLLEIKDKIKVPDEVFLKTEPLYIWFDAIRIIQNNFEVTLAADQTNPHTGESYGFVYHGSIRNVVRESANLCTKLSALPEVTSTKSNNKIKNKNRNRNDNRISKKIEKLIYQESNSKCSFCDESVIAALDIHHIISRESGGLNEIENLILVCKNCHGKIHDGIISLQDIVKKKIQLATKKHESEESNHRTPIFNLNNNKIESSVIANQVNFKYSKNPRKIAYPLGCIGANINMNNYIKYLIDKYYKYREADKSYGRYDVFHHSEIHTSIQSRFKAKTYFIKESKFNELCEYLYFRVERTIQGKRNTANGVKNYDTFEKFINN